MNPVKLTTVENALANCDGAPGRFSFDKPKTRCNRNVVLNTKP
jgi:hypothetical protein